MDCSKCNRKIYRYEVVYCVEGKSVCSGCYSDWFGDKIGKHPVYTSFVRDLNAQN